MSTQTTPDEVVADAATALRQAFDQHQAGQVKRAMETYRRVLAVHPDNADAWHLCGIATQQFGDLDGAEEMIRRADELRPGHAPFLSNLGSLHNERGQLAAAEDALRRAVAANGSYAPAHINLGHLLRGAKRPAEAVESYRRATAAAPDYAAAWRHLARALDFVGETLEAIAAYRRLHELDTNVDIEDRVKLGVLLQRTGKLEEAKQIFADVLSEAPTPSVHLNLGSLQKELGDDGKAVEAFQAAVAVDPNYALAHRHLGFALLDTGEFTGAEESFQRAVALNPEDALVREQLALLLAEQDKFEEAAAAALVPSRCATGPDDADAAIDAAKIHHDLGQLRYLRYRDRLPSELSPLLFEYEQHAAAWLRHGATRLNDLRPTPSRAFRTAYNRLLHVAAAPPVEAAIEPACDMRTTAADIQAHGCAIVDGVLSANAVAILYDYCLESTVWTKTPAPGVVATDLGAGFAPAVLFQIAAELRRALPAVLGGRRLIGCRAARYDNDAAIEIQAERGAVCVNLWITPDAANRSRGVGCLLLRPAAAPEVAVPYRCNRAVIFPCDTKLHPAGFEFGNGFAERRMSVTLLFGN